ncbi:MAG: immune inhibitor A [Candidatus Cloacimonetes bacterium]|nr:immune inhibitor A [Candidatus Cloacimonadota bacterium]
MNKKTTIFVALFILIYSISFAGKVTQTYYFDKPEILMEEEYATIKLENAVTLGEPGEPEIPYLGINLLLPQNEVITDVTLSFGNEIYLGDYLLKPKQKQIPISKSDQFTFTEPNQTVYAKKEQFPQQKVRGQGTNFLAGYSVGSVAITPINYIPAQNKLSYYDEVTVTFNTEYASNAEAAGRFLFADNNTQKRLNRIVDNPQEIDSYNISKQKSTYFDYIIITTSDNEDDYQALVDFHSHRGFRTKIELIGDIYDDYTGVDNPEKIRNYLIDEYAQGPLQFVLLGGDTDDIPHRGLYADPGSGYADDDIPADMYYACLDRGPGTGTGPDWNNNNNGYWGEPDEADLIAEFNIGRIATNTDAEIANAINKMQMYSESPVLGDQEDVLLVGELLWTGPNTYGGTYMDELIGNCSNNGYTTNGIPALWNISKLYQLDYSWTSQDLYDELNLGPNIVSHLGHGSTTHCLNIDNPDLTTYNITNNGIDYNFFNGYSQACYSGSIDNRTSYGNYGQDCFSEKITIMETAAATFVSNSRYGWGERGGTDGASQHFARQWVDAFFDEGVYTIAGANQLSKEQTIPFIQSNQVIRWCAYELNVLGDPALDLWTSTPEEQSPTYPQTIMAGTPEIDVSGAPYSRITVYDDDTIYGYGTVGEFGTGTLTFDNPPTEPGIINISVVAHDYEKYVGEITITASIVTLNPQSIPVNEPTEITVNVMSPDSTEPEVGVEVWAEGLNYTSDSDITDDDGNATINIDYPYGPGIDIYGQKSGQSYYTFHEEIEVVASEFSSPELNVSTTFGLADTFAANLPGVIHAFATEDDYELWVDVDESGYSCATDDTMEVTPATMNPVKSLIAKSGYDLYQENFPVIVAYGTVSGLVTDSDNGTPVSNAEVRFYEEGGDPTEDPLFTATTNSNGIYEVADPYEVDNYDIYIDKWGFNPYQELGYFLGYAENIHDIEIEPVESGMVHGKIVDNFFILGEGNLTYIRSDNGEEFASVDIQDQSYSVTLPHFTYEIYVTAPNHVPYVGTITIDGDMEIDYHLGNALLQDNCEDGLSQWNDNYWGLTEQYAVSPTHSFTDSPGGNYPNNYNASLETYDTISLTGATSGALYFNARWDIESDWDYAQVLASTDGTNWTALEGDYTEPGTGSFQPSGEPVYDGAQTDWVYETSDLSDFIGEEIYLKFTMTSDSYINEDGIYVDDILIGDPNSSYEIPITSTNNNNEPVTSFRLKQNYPNPVTASTTISFSLPTGTKNCGLKIYNLKGQLVKQFKPDTENSRSFDISWDGTDMHNRPVANGVYFYRLSTEKKDITKKMILLK